MTFFVRKRFEDFYDIESKPKLMENNYVAQNCLISESSEKQGSKYLVNHELNQLSEIYLVKQQELQNITNIKEDLLEQIDSIRKQTKKYQEEINQHRKLNSANISKMKTKLRKSNTNINKQNLVQTKVIKSNKDNFDFSNEFIVVNRLKQELDAKDKDICNQQSKNQWMDQELIAEKVNELVIIIDNILNTISVIDGKNKLEDYKRYEVSLIFHFYHEEAVPPNLKQSFSFNVTNSGLLDMYQIVKTISKKMRQLASSFKNRIFDNDYVQVKQYEVMKKLKLLDRNHKMDFYFYLAVLKMMDDIYVEDQEKDTADVSRIKRNFHFEYYSKYYNNFEIFSNNPKYRQLVFDISRNKYINLITKVALYVLKQQFKNHFHFKMVYQKERNQLLLMLELNQKKYGKKELLTSSNFHYNFHVNCISFLIQKFQFITKYQQFVDSNTDKLYTQKYKNKLSNFRSQMLQILGIFDQNLDGEFDARQSDYYQDIVKFCIKELKYNKKLMIGKNDHKMQLNPQYFNYRLFCEQLSSFLEIDYEYEFFTVQMYSKNHSKLTDFLLIKPDEEDQIFANKLVNYGRNAYQINHRLTLLTKKQFFEVIKQQLINFGLHDLQDKDIIHRINLNYDQKVDITLSDFLIRSSVQAIFNQKICELMKINRCYNHINFRTIVIMLPFLIVKYVLEADNQFIKEYLISIVVIVLQLINQFKFNQNLTEIQLVHNSVHLYKKQKEEKIVKTKKYVQVYLRILIIVLVKFGVDVIYSLVFLHIMENSFMAELFNYISNLATIVISFYVHHIQKKIRISKWHVVSMYLYQLFIFYSGVTALRVSNIIDAQKCMPVGSRNHQICLKYVQDGAAIAIYIMFCLYFVKYLYENSKILNITNLNKFFKQKIQKDVRYKIISLCVSIYRFHKLIMTDFMYMMVFNMVFFNRVLSVINFRSLLFLVIQQICHTFVTTYMNSTSTTQNLLEINQNLKEIFMLLSSINTCITIIGILVQLIMIRMHRPVVFIILSAAFVSMIYLMKQPRFQYVRKQIRQQINQNKVIISRIKKMF